MNQGIGPSARSIEWPRVKINPATGPARDVWTLVLLNVKAVRNGGPEGDSLRGAISVDPMFIGLGFQQVVVSGVTVARSALNAVQTISVCAYDIAIGVAATRRPLPTCALSGFLGISALRRP